jgi:isoleucyl-tRNA synthetase
MTQPDQKKEKKKDPFRHTLHLPKTSFGMKANLVQMEPRFQKRWERIDLYQSMRNLPHPHGAFVFHDGPPYANGNIHIGHMLNKILKDLILRHRTMAGFDVDFVPGWDCHGQPIEHKVLKELGSEAAQLEPAHIRKKCKNYAQKYVKIQAGQMKRLGTMGRYDEPYLTMLPAYEGATLEVFADLVERDLVYRSLKPVHWSIENQTALAEAELEYMNRQDTSVFVLFPLADSSLLPEGLNLPSSEAASLMIWTTTPWTLPANLAVAVHPDEGYGLFRMTKDGQERLVLLAESLSEKVFQLGGATDIEWLGGCRGSELVKAQVSYRHPFIDRISPVVEADYVTMEDGTGMVHTAPGHGEEDYQTGLRTGLEIYCPVRADGTFDSSVPEWLQGKDVWTANTLIVDKLRDEGVLFFDQLFEHSYPHDWRGKTPTIFRATEQWFISVDKEMKGVDRSLRQMALDAVDHDITFIPAWGHSRLKGMLDSRPDWCISRQRFWGLPIPAFLAEGEEPLLTGKSVRAVAKRVREKGADCWYYMSPVDILGDYDPSDDPDAPLWLQSAGRAGLEKLTLSKDIFDVWFESGSSWNAVLRERNIGFPSDVYVEGSDQHRGWFQLSLLPALGVMQKPPFKTLLTHGFIVDAQGKKMSKSLGNAIEVEELVGKYGADVCRWWVSGLSYTGDIKTDWHFFQVASDEYRKIRNTFRFLLGNLDDFDWDRDAQPLTDKDVHTIDAWALMKLEELIQETSHAYEHFQYAKVRELIFNFCNDTLSSVYLACIKDRLYCDAKDGARRRRTQTMLFRIADVLSKIMAPILVHTADEAWCALYGKNPDETNESVHLQSYPSIESPQDIDTQAWTEVMALRSLALRTFEHTKAELDMTNPLDAGIEATLCQKLHQHIAPYVDELADLCGMSRFVVHADDHQDEGAHIIIVDLRGEPRCDRSWKRDGSVCEREGGHFLSERDHQVIANLSL